MQDEVFDLGSLFRTFLRSFWILMIGVVAGGLIAVYLYGNEEPQYSSTAKLIVLGTSNSGGLSAGDIDASRRISQLYGDLAKTRPILDAVAESDDVPYSGGQLSEKMKVSESRSFIEITVTDLDPVLAAIVANVTAITLIRELADRQIAQIAQFQNSLEQLGLQSEAAIVATQAANLPLLTVAEEAVPPGTPIGTAVTRIRRVILGGVLGLMAAAGLVVVRSMFDDTIKSEGDLATSTGLMILGAIPKYRQPKNGTPILLSGNGRHHPATESYYIIRANMNYALPSGTPISSILVTGPGPGEGKSTVASNLAIAFAREGNSVVLVDADLRRPVQHLMFGVDRSSEEPGVVDVLAGTATVDQALAVTNVDGLKLVTAGEPPVDPDLLLRSKYFRQLKNRISEIADIVVYDSPPVLVVSDPLLLVEDVDLTILVTEAGSTKRKAARRAAESLNRPNAGTTVAVLTKQRTGLTGYGYDYGYANYYGSHGVGGRRERASRLVRSLVSRVMFWKDGNFPVE